MLRSLSLWVGALTLAFSTVALAQSALTGDAFERESEGQVFDIYSEGRLVQREEFLPDRRVRLGFPPEGHDPSSLVPIPCVDGRWEARGDTICFFYQRPSGEVDGPHCWDIQALPEGRQRAVSRTPGSELQLELNVAEVPLICRGPEVGV